MRTRNLREVSAGIRLPCVRRWRPRIVLARTARGFKVRLYGIIRQSFRKQNTSIAAAGTTRPCAVQSHSSDTSVHAADPIYLASHVYFDTCRYALMVIVGWTVGKGLSCSLLRPLDHISDDSLVKMICLARNGSLTI